MKTYEQAVDAAGKALSACNTIPAHVQAHWSSLEWLCYQKPLVTAFAERSRNPGEETINLYPDLLRLQDARPVLLEQFGLVLYEKCGQQAAQLWEQKLALPSDEQIAAVQLRLGHGFGTYRELVESFKTTMDRLVALHIANALNASGVSAANAREVKIREWGATAEYANSQRPHSLIPVLSAYAPRRLADSFGLAFADHVLNRLTTVREGSVREATRGLVLGILELAR